MMEIRHKCLQAALAILLATAVTPSAYSQGTGLVSSSDLVYADIDRLAELGVLDSVIIGQRPYSRREIDRIVTAARRRLASTRPSGALSEQTMILSSTLLTNIERRMGGSPVLGPRHRLGSLVDGLTVSGTSTDTDRRSFPNSWARFVEASIDPLAARRLGDQTTNGVTSTLEVANRLEPTSWLAVQARERFDYLRRRGSAEHGRAELLLASVRGRYRNTALTVGRQQYTWAQSEDDGIFLASDAPALDQISLASDQPFTMPGFLSRLGATQATLIYADLGPSKARSHSRLVAYKVSVSPSSAIEIGGRFGSHFGGEGSRSSSAVDRFIDLVPFLDVLRRHNYYDTTRTLEVESDKVLALDGRLRFRQLAGLTIAGEVQLEDFDPDRLTDLFTGYGAQSVNFIFPSLGSPYWSAKLTAKHTGFVTYTHGQLINGFSSRGRLLGDEMGPDTRSFGAQLRWTPSAAVRLELEGRSVNYSNAEYQGFYSDSARTQFNVYKTGSSHSELRDIGIASLVFQNETNMALTLRAAGERIRMPFIGNPRKDFAGEIAIRIGQ